MPNSHEPHSESPGQRVCEVCGGLYEAMRFGAQCPRCLLNLASAFGLPGDASPREDLLGPLQVRNFGDYELLDEIARGGMGVVYRAHQVSLNRDVAIKMIIAGELAGAVALRMFQVEAHAAANLHHPNIVPVYEIGEHEMQPYFTMRFVPGGRTIAHWAKDHREDPRALAAAAAKVARAVAHAHTRSILHRDLKPSNILWDPEAGPQVTDFGLAKILDPGEGEGTRSGQSMGSPSYMAPEQMSGHTTEITTITDVYGLGAVLYEMLAGRPPFAGTSPIETLRRAAEEAPAPLPAVPRDLRTVCFKCLAKDPADRYPSADAVADDLERFARGEPVSVVPLSAPQILWRWAKRRPRPAALIAICLLSIVSGLAGIIWQWRKAEVARAEQARALAHLHWREIDRWLEEGDTSRALAYLASLLRAQPDRWPATMYAMSIVERFHFSVLAGPKVQPPARLSASARLAPDGSWFAGAGEDQKVRIWNTASGRETAVLPQSAPVTALAVAEGPFALAVAGQSGEIQLYAHANAGAAAQPLRLSQRGSEPMKELSFSADGSHLLGFSRAGAEVWRLDDPSRPASVFSLPDRLASAVLSADGARLLAWNAHEAAVWDTASGRELFHVASQETFQDGALAAAGSRVALIDGRFSVRIFEIDSAQALPTLAIPLIPITHVVLDAAGNRLTMSGISNDLSVVDVASGLRVSPPMKHHYAVHTLAISPDGNRTISYGWDNVVRVWDAHLGRSEMVGIPLEGLFRPDIEPVPSRDGSFILVQTPEEKNTPASLSVWRATPVSEPQHHTVDGERAFESAGFSPDGRLGCLGLWPGRRFHVYELATGRVVLDKVVEGAAYAALFSADSRKFFCFTANGWLHGWSLDTGEELWKPNHQPGNVLPAALSPDGTRLIAGHSDGHIRIYDTATGQLVGTLDHPGSIRVLRFAPDGSGRFVSGSTDGTARVWDLKTGRQLQVLSGHSETIITAGWSPDGRLVATGSYDQTVRVWDAATGRPVGHPLPHNGPLSHLEFAPGGTLLATACRDGTARMWHALTGEPASPQLLQGSACDSVLFTADGAALLVRDHDGFRFWDTATAEPVTVHYPEPESSGLGLDAACYRAMLSPAGDRVFLGHSMDVAALWSVPQPRDRAPAWLPDFLEMLAQIRFDDSGETQPVNRATANSVVARLRQSPPGDPFAVWARRILGL